MEKDLKDIIRNAKALLVAMETGTLEFPDGVENGTRDLETHLDTAREALSGLADYYL